MKKAIIIAALIAAATPAISQIAAWQFMEMEDRVAHLENKIGWLEMDITINKREIVRHIHECKTPFGASPALANPV